VCKRNLTDGLKTFYLISTIGQQKAHSTRLSFLPWFTSLQNAAISGVPSRDLTLS